MLSRPSTALSELSLTDFADIIRSDLKRGPIFCTEEWICALSVPGVGVYNVFGGNGDGGLDEIIDRMKREGNTRVTRIGAIKVGGGFFDPPEEVVAAVRELDPANADIIIITT